MLQPYLFTFRSQLSFGASELSDRYEENEHLVSYIIHNAQKALVFIFIMQMKQTIPDAKTRDQKLPYGSPRGRGFCPNVHRWLIH